MSVTKKAVFQSKTAEAPESFKRKYTHYLEQCRNDSRGFDVIEAFRYDQGTHPGTYVDYECTFAAYFLSRMMQRNHVPRFPRILDIGSYRHFILGLLSHYYVTTVDVRERQAATDHETTVTGDAKRLALPDQSFDALVSLCAIEHFGLGRYGDDFDLDADRTALEEMKRVLKPRGALIFTTTITRAKPQLAFNAHRIYNYPMIESFCEGLRLEGEFLYLSKKGAFGPREEVTKTPGAWDIYCGCWTKP